VNHPSSLDGLFAEAPRSPRSWASVAASAVLHAVAIAVFLVLAHSAATGTLPRVGRTPLRFVSLMPAPDPALLVPVRTRPLRVPPAAIRKTPVSVELLAPPIEKRIETPPPIEIKAMPKPVAPEPRLAKPTAVEPARPAPVVAVGAFASATPAAHAIEPLRQVQQAGFDAPAAHAPDIASRTAAVGAFDQPAAAAARPQPGSDRPNIVADAGFGTAMAAASSRPAARAVSDAGFGGAAGAAGAAAPRTSAQQAVRTTEFDARPAPPVATPAPRGAGIEIPLEILSKPTPEYTDEARSLKIEGDVLLEVNFSAAGQVHVVRVVRGLGHGLDESAIRAAQGMHFKPAQNAGRPTDFKTTVHIVFRLA
jgi:TonB family protein